MITKYAVAWANTTDKLAEFVNKDIQNGWQPLGGVAIAVSTEWLHGNLEQERTLFCQAVVRTDGK